MDLTLNDGQQLALDMIKYNRIGVLSGSAGTGKTTVIKKIIEWAKTENLRVLCCCPSGKAAKRLQEATSFPASTIHKALSSYMNENGNFEFKKNKKNTLEADLVIVDECSMVGNNLMARLLEAIPEKSYSGKVCKVLLTGDPRQLPSIQAGNVLLDIIKSKCVQCVDLVETFRFSGDIIDACTAIRNGKYYKPSSTLNIEEKNNYIHIECDNEEKILNIMTSLIKDKLPLPKYKFNPIWDCQIISPVNTRGALSCESINFRIRNEINPLKPPAKQDQDTSFRVGDKIINTKNREIVLKNKQSDYVVNGDLGEVFEILEDEKKMGIIFKDPERKTFLPKKDPNILGAYAITCHRMQGSESPVVIIPVHKSFGRSLNRSWIYTAISRGRDIVITIGQQQVINSAIDNNKSVQRQTKLQEKLLNLFIQDI